MDRGKGPWLHLLTLPPQMTQRFRSEIPMLQYLRIPKGTSALKSLALFPLDQITLSLINVRDFYTRKQSCCLSRRVRVHSYLNDSPTAKSRRQDSAIYRTSALLALFILRWPFPSPYVKDVLISLPYVGQNKKFAWASWFSLKVQECVLNERRVTP